MELSKIAKETLILEIRQFNNRKLDEFRDTKDIKKSRIRKNKSR